MSPRPTRRSADWSSNGFNPCIRFLTGTAANNTVAGNFLGVDPTGMTAVPTGAGVLILGQSNNTIGGTSPADRNLISGCNPAGIDMSGGSGNVIEGNYVGTNASGTAALPNVQAMTVDSASTQIGGAAAGAGNLLSGNNEGILLSSGAAGTVIEGNLIGTDAGGNAPLANHFNPVYIASNGTTIGGPGAGSGNVIAFNAVPGIIAAGGTGNTFRGNSIHDNVSLGIDLGNDGVTANDIGDADTGPNNLQNFPVISSVVYGASSTTVMGLLNSTASTTFQLEPTRLAPTFPVSFSRAKPTWAPPRSPPTAPAMRPSTSRPCPPSPAGLASLPRPPILPATRPSSPRGFPSPSTSPRDRPPGARPSRSPAPTSSRALPSRSGASTPRASASPTTRP